MKMKYLLMTSVIAMSTLCALASCESSDKVKIGILQYATHDALGQVTKGFQEKLAELGYGEDKVSYTMRNPEGDANQLITMSNYFATNSFDLTLGIATPAALALKSAYDGERNNGPILFSAVTDAVSVELVESNEEPGGNVTGTVDMNPVAEQVELLTEINPDIETLGIIYTATENNSKIQSDLAVAYCEANNIECTVRTIGTINDLQTVASALVSQVDALYIPTDNVVASAMQTISTVIGELDTPIPVSCGETGMVSAGGTVTYGLDYYILGEQTAAMAKDILDKTKTPSEIPVEGQRTFKLFINKTLADEQGITIPQAMLDRADEII